MLPFSGQQACHQSPVPLSIKKLGAIKGETTFFVDGPDAAAHLELLNPMVQISQGRTVFPVFFYLHTSLPMCFWNPPDCTLHHTFGVFTMTRVRGNNTTRLVLIHHQIAESRVVLRALVVPIAAFLHSMLLHNVMTSIILIILERACTSPPC